MRHSIRQALLKRLMLPLMLLMILGGACAYGLARHFSQTVLDYWLYDSAISLANRITFKNGKLVADLPDGAREILEWDTVDRVYYDVVSRTTGRLVGNGNLPDPPAKTSRLFSWPAYTSSNEANYYNATVNGEIVRVLAIHHVVGDTDQITVKVAETRHKSDALADQVLWISMVLSIGLTAVSGMIIWYGVGSGITFSENAVRSVRKEYAKRPLDPVSKHDDCPSELLPLVQEIDNLYKDLSAAHNLNQRFIADAAHQLRTPISTLRVQLEMASREHIPVRHAKAIEDAIGVLAQMGRMIHQLLALAKADQNDDVRQNNEPVNINLLARKEAERRIDAALAAGIDLGLSESSEPVWVKGNESLLREAVANLLDNALHYGAGGKLVTIGVRASPKEVYVEDLGPGLPAEERDKVRQRFYRVPGSPGEGCGLGLSIVDEIVRRHGGQLLLNAGPNGSGLCAVLRFSNTETQ